MLEVNDSAPVETAEAVENVEGEEQQQDVKPEVQAAPQSNKKKFTFKVDGEELTEEIDLNDEDTLKKHLSMSKAAYKRMQEAATIKRQNEQFIRMLQEDPIKVLTHEQFGGSKKFREIAEQYLAKQIEEQMLSPEEKHKRDMEARLRQYEDQERQVKAQREAEQIQKLEQHYAQDFEQKIIKGLNSQGIPKTTRTVKRMAELMSKNLQHGLELEPEHLAEIVKQDYVNEMKEMFGASEGDILLKLLGDDVANKIRKSDLARLRGGQSFQSGGQPFKQSSINSAEKVPANMSKEEWKAWIDKRSKS